MASFFLWNSILTRKYEPSRFTDFVIVSHLTTSTGGGDHNDCEVRERLADIRATINVSALLCSFERDVVVREPRDIIRMLK